jgi:hypothetical protein
LKQFAERGQSPPAPVSRQEFARKFLPRISHRKCFRAEKTGRFLAAGFWEEKRRISRNAESL